MPSKVYSAAVVGVEAFEVEIEVHAGWGNTDKIAVVALPDTAVKESKDRVTSTICNSGLRWPYCRKENESPLTWPRPMSGRKDPALTCRSSSKSEAPGAKKEP
jgi:Subunit ChlI of Mg-chelatase